MQKTLVKSIRIAPELKDTFFEICSLEGVSPSFVITRLISQVLHLPLTVPIFIYPTTIPYGKKTALLGFEIGVSQYRKFEQLCKEHEINPNDHIRSYLGYYVETHTDQVVLPLRIPLTLYEVILQEASNSGLSPSRVILRKISEADSR